MRAVDTNVLVRLLTRDDPKQTAAAEAWTAGGAWVSHLVLVESVWVLAAVYERTPRQIAEVIGQLLEHESLVIQDPETVAFALNRFRNKSAPEFSDCLILEIARKAGHVPLGSFDRELGRQEDTVRLKG